MLDFNQRHFGLQPNALATELIVRNIFIISRITCSTILVYPEGFEPSTRTSSRFRSTTELWVYNLAKLEGIEPSTLRRQRRILPLNYSSIILKHLGVTGEY